MVEVKVKKRRSTLAQVRRDYQLYIMLIPVIVYYIMFMYKPMYGLQIAFKDYSLFKGVLDSPWCGFKHFIKFFSANTKGYNTRGRFAKA